MIRFTQKELDAILADFLGKPYRRMATGPDAYDCYGLVKAFMGRIGVDIPEIGKVDPKDSRPVYEQQQTDYVRLDWPRPWSLVTFSGKDLNAHIGVVLPNDNLFLHCPGRAAGKVIAEPLSRRPWRDTIDGYWWPRSYLETIIMLTPMTTKRAWQFVRCDGRSLRQIIEQDITEGRDVQVQAFLEGEAVDPADWDLVPGPVNQLVIRPIMGEGEQGLMMVGMVALAVLAPYAAAALMGPTASASIAAGTATSSTMMTYSLAKAAIMMGGALALNALVGPGEGSKDRSQHYTWDPVTTQRVGSFVPLVYGTYGVRGNVICSYATSEIVTEINWFNKETQVDYATDLYWLKIAYSDGPIDGVVAGTERLNGKDPQQYAGSDDFVLEHFTGTDDQAASSVPDAFEIPVNQLCDDPTGGANEVTTTFTAVKCDRAAVVLRFPNGFTRIEKDGDHAATMVGATIRIREAGGVWHTLADEEIWGDTKQPVRIHRWFDETYTGGSAFTLVAGTTYEVGVTRNNSRHHDHADDFYFDCIQCAFTTAQKHPGLAYTAIGAAASKYISGAIDYYVKIKGKLVRVYDDATSTWSIEWSDNPAWVAYDVLTRPVIKGNGDSVPYAVESYRRLDPSYLVLDDFVALADWCDTMVSDEAGGTEKRFVFNGVFDEEGSTWDQAIRVLRSACAMPYFRGNQIGVVIDKPGTPVQMFNVSNLREGFSETWIDTSEAATVYDAEFYDETGDYGAESWPVPLQGAAQDIPASLDCFGHTKRSRVWRYASRQLRVNQYMKRMVEIPACLDAIYTNLGDIVYVQHPSLQRAIGGRIVEVYADGVKVDKPVTMGAGDYGLLIRTHDGTAERLTLYEVVSVSGDDDDIVTISGTWEYTPDVNDLFTFGEEVKVIDLYRVKGFERAGNGQVLIQAAQYTTDYYTDDEEAPKIEAKTYSQTKGGIAPSLLPTTAQAVAADRADGNSAVDTVLWEGLSFTGNGVDKVTWTCSGAGIKYKGVWCPIEDDAVGTTDKYIYFDPNIGDPRYLQHTDDLADLAGYERYVFCINDGGVAYFQPGVLMTSDDVKLYNIEAGATVGATWGVNITDQPDGYLVEWQGTLTAHPASPEEGWAYRNSTDGKSYIYHDSAWYQMTADGVDGANGADGEDGLSIVWRGESSSPPASPATNHAYRDTDDGIIYIYNGTAWEPMVYDGSDGTDGAAGSDGADGLSVFITYHDNAYDNPPSTPTGDGTTGGWHTNATSAVVWLSQKTAADASSGTWGTPFRVAGVDGADGADGAAGVDGTDGTSIVWQGTYASHPASPSNGWAYYNSTDGKSYVYQSGTWYQMTVDGVDGANGADGEDGLSIVWHGDAASPDPSWEVVNHCYRDTDNGYAYIYNGTAWELMVRDGSDGTAGTDGTDGLSVFVTYHDNAADTQPSDPTGDGTTGGWHTNVTSSVVWISQKVAADASSGTWGTPIRISGTAIWSEVIDDGGKPEDGATAGATWGQDIVGQPFDMQNLVKKPTFEDGSLGTWFGNNITLSDVTGQVWTKALASSSRHVIEYSPYTTAMPTCVPGEKFYLEADVNTEASSYDFILYARFVNAAMGPAQWVAANTLAAGQGWTRLKGVVTAPANCMYVMVDLFTSASSGFGTVLVTNIHLSRYNPDADVTAEHQGDINIDNIQDGSSYKKLSAANLTALESAINLDTPQPRNGWEGAFTSNSPSAGYVAWTSFVIRYQGTDYTIGASNSNKKYLYWNAGGTKTQLYGTDAIGDALGTGKFIVGYNEGGTFYPAQFIKIIHGALIQAATILAEHLSVSQLSAIVADLGTVTAGTIILSLGGDNRLKISTSGIQGSDDGGSSWYNIITTDGGKVVIEGDVVKAGTIIADAIADDELTVFRSVNTAASVAFSTSSYATIQSRSFPASGGVVHLTIQVQLKTDSGSGDVVNWQILRGTTEIVSGTQAITNAWKTYAFSCIDLPSSGSYTYYFKVKGVVAAGDAQNRIMYCEEAIK